MAQPVVPGRALQVDPIKPTLKASGSKHLNLEHNELLSSFAFNFNLRHYALEKSNPQNFAQLVEQSEEVMLKERKVQMGGGAGAGAGAGGHATTTLHHPNLTRLRHGNDATSQRIPQKTSHVKLRSGRV